MRDKRRINRDYDNEIILKYQYACTAYEYYGIIFTENKLKTWVVCRNIRFKKNIKRRRNRKGEESGSNRFIRIIVSVNL